MKISKETLSLLNNFADINNSIVVKAGNRLTTMSESATILADAVVQETFPQDFAIYDLSIFLNAINLLKDPEFHFGKDTCEISDGDQSFIFVYANPEIIRRPPEGKKIRFPDPKVEFKLSQTQFHSIKRAHRVMKLPHFVVKNKDQKLILSVMNCQDQGSNHYNMALGMETDQTLFCVFDLSNIRILDADYEIGINKLSRFSTKTETMTLDYYISAEANSEFE